MGKAVLVDLTRCIGCRGCQVACKEWNGRAARKTSFHGEFTNPAALSSDCYTRIEFVETEKKGAPAWNFVKSQCLHCKDPACVSACPVGALTKSASGPVEYTFNKCIGCRYCMMACPFDIPKYEWSSAQPWVQKCSFCAERILDGMEPACIKTCPTGAMYYNEYDNVVSEARKRIAASAGKYVDHIYGLNEVGGTSWMYVSDVPFDKLGFKTNLPAFALPSLSWTMLSSLPVKVLGLVALLAVVAYTRNKENRKEGEA